MATTTHTAAWTGTDEQPAPRITEDWLSVGIGLVIVGLNINQTNQAAGILIVLGVILLAACGIWALFFRQDLNASNVTASHVWITGVHPDFLAGLPAAFAGSPALCLTSAFSTWNVPTSGSATS